MHKYSVPLHSNLDFPLLIVTSTWNPRKIIIQKYQTGTTKYPAIALYTLSYFIHVIKSNTVNFTYSTVHECKEHKNSTCTGYTSFKINEALQS